MGPMLDWLLSLLLIAVPAHDVQAFQATTGKGLDPTTAALHLLAARAAGEAYKLDPDLLLAIAWRESRYQVDAVTKERSGKLSCGVMMTTEPLGKPCPAPDVFTGYMQGASHLASWMRLAGGDQRKALLGYAGGYPMIRACSDGGQLLRVRAGREVDLCKTPELARAAWIRRVRERVIASGS